jgi:hypothetical protein
MGKPKRPQLRWSVDDELPIASDADCGELFWLGETKWLIQFSNVEHIGDRSAIDFHQCALSILMAYRCEAKPPFETIKYQSKLTDKEIGIVFPAPCPAIVDNAFLLFKHSETLVIESGLEAKADAICGYYWGLIHRDTQEAETLVGESMKQNGDKIAQRNRRAKWKPDRQEVLAVLVPIGSTCTKKTQAIEKAAKQFRKSPRLLHDVIKGLKIADKDWLIKKN